jgi:threonine/homoserine/homoserine lactone efflux protein
MILNFLAGILTGFIVSIPPMGPIAFAIITKGFQNEIKDGRAIALGAAFMDFFYCMLAFGGITLIISFFPVAATEFYSKYAYEIKIVLTFIGCAIVFIYGLKILKTKIIYNELETKESGKIKLAINRADVLQEKAKSISNHLNISGNNKSNSFGLFFMGVMLCMSSLTLPASWIAVVGYLKGFNFLNSTFLGGLLFSIGALTGTYLWFYSLLKIITGNKKRINQSTVNKLNIVAGIILLLLGVLLFAKATVSVFYI